MKDEYKFSICFIVAMILALLTTEILSVSAAPAFLVGMVYGLIAMVVNEKWCNK